ncbi:hypothetical protein V8E36_002343, partial [Tilletia maclaganii]
MSHLIRLYKCVVVPRSEYGALVWHTFGSSATWGALKRLQSIQNKALRRALGAFSTTPLEAIHFDCNVVPVTSRLDTRVAEQALKLLAGSSSNPASVAARKAMRHPTNRWRTNLATIFLHEAFAERNMSAIEHLSPSAAERSWRSLFTSEISSSIEEAVVSCLRLRGTPIDPVFFTDGSMSNGAVAAAALEEWSRLSAQALLGSAMDYTVFDGELRGINLALSIAQRNFQQLNAVTI